jgi:phosphate-selective porin OprO/OprP
MSKLGHASLIAMALGCAAVSGSAPAHARDGAGVDVRGLTDRLNRLEQDNRALRNRVKGLEMMARRRRGRREEPPEKQASEAARTNAGGSVHPAPFPPVFVSFRNGLFVESDDKAYSFKIGGRLLIDGGGATSPIAGLSGDVGFNQAWMQVEGRAAHIWEYKFAYEFAQSSPVGAAAGIRDAYLVLKHPALALPFTSEPVAIEIGNQWEPMGLERSTAKTTIDFLERSLATDAFGAARHIGASALAHGRNWTLKAGVFSTSVEDRALSPAATTPVPFWVSPAAGWTATNGSQYFDVSARATYAPILESDRMIHLGVSGRYHQPNGATAASDDRVMALGSNTFMESNTLRTNLLGTPDLSCGSYAFGGLPAVSGNCVRDVVGYGAELAASYGPLSVQAEYLGAHYDRRADRLAVARAAGDYAPGGTSLDFNGYYVYGLWYLTGESRAASYSVSNIAGPATFGSIQIKHPLSAGGWGAWALGARYSAVDLNNGPYQGSAFANLDALAPNPALRAGIANSSVNGGREEDATVGLNWYPDDGVRIMANWTHVTRLAAPWNRPYLGGAHPSTFLLRTQIVW